MADACLTVRFDEVAAQVSDRVDDPSTADVERYVGLEHLDAERLRIRRWGSPTDVESTKLLFSSGDIIFGKRRAYQRKLALADFPGICSAHAMVLRARPEGVEPQFLPYFLQSDAFFKRALSISVGSLSPTINWKALARQEFRLPSRPSQLRIARLLQAADANAYAVEATFDAAKQATAAHAAEFFSGGPETVMLESVAEVRSGLTVNASRRTYDEEAPYLRVANVADGSLSLEELKIIGIRAGDLDRYSLRNGDILVVEGHASGEEVGRSALWRGEVTPCLHQNHLFCVRASDHVRPEFLSVCLQSPALRRYFTSRAKSTSGLHTINSTVVRQAPVRVGSLGEQDAFLSAHGRFVACEEAQRRRVTASWELVAALREHLLTQETRHVH